MAETKLKPTNALEAVLLFHMTGPHDSISYWDKDNVGFNRDWVTTSLKNDGLDEEEIEEYLEPGFWYTCGLDDTVEHCGTTSQHVAAWCMDYFSDQVDEVVQELLANPERCKFINYPAHDELKALWRIHELERGLYRSKSRPRDRRRIEALKKKAKRLIAERRLEQENLVGPHAHKLRMEIEEAMA